jgi:hypothetical protein
VHRRQPHLRGRGGLARTADLGPGTGLHARGAIIALVAGRSAAGEAWCRETEGGSDVVFSSSRLLVFSSSVAIAVALANASRAQVTFPPENVGAWVDKFNHPQDGDPTWPSTFNAVHMALIPVSTAGTGAEHRGNVIVWDVSPPPATQQRWAIVDPLTHTTWNFRLQLPDSNVSPGQGDIFCCGQTWTERGNLFLAGGSIYDATPGHDLVGGSKLTYLWDATEWNDPAKNRGWYRQADLAVARYYPTAMRMADDRMMVAGGVDDVQSYKDHPNPPMPSNYEAFRQTTNHAGVWDSIAGNQVFQGPTEPGSDVFQIYPRLHPLVGPFDVPAGWVFYAGFGEDNGRAFHDPTNLATIWDTTVGHAPLWFGQRPYLHYGSSILQPVDLNVANPARDRLMRFGGGAASQKWVETRDGSHPRRVSEGKCIR